MATKVVLLLALVGNLTSATFDDPAACEQAVAEFEAALVPQGLRPGQLVHTCSPAGSEEQAAADDASPAPPSAPIPGPRFLKRR